MIAKKIKTTFFLFSEIEKYDNNLQKKEIEDNLILCQSEVFI